MKETLEFVNNNSDKLTLDPQLQKQFNETYAKMIALNCIVEEYEHMLESQTASSEFDEVNLHNNEIDLF